MEECPREGLQSVKSREGTRLLALEERQGGESLMSQGRVLERSAMWITLRASNICSILIRRVIGKEVM